MNELLAVLRNPNLRLLMLGRFISSGGDYFYQVALSVAIFQYSGGVQHASRASFYVGLLWIIRLIPALTLAAIGGSLASRLGYRRAMIIADVARLVLLLILAALLRSSTWPVIYPLAFLITAFGRLFFPASVGLIPSLVESREQRLAANATTAQAESLAAILGSASGGIIAGLGWINQLLLIDAGTFAVSALCLWLIRPRPAPARAPAAETGEPEEEMGKGFIAGLRFLARRPVLVFAVTAMALPELASGALFVWIVPYAIQQLHLGNAGVGYFYATLGVGYLLGGFAATAIGSSVRLDRLVAVSVAIGGVAYALWGLWTVAAGALACILLVGLAETVEFAAYETLLQQAVPEDAIGRASGLVDSVLFNMVFIGTAISGLLAASPIGLRASIVATGSVVVLATIVAWWRFQRETAGQPDAAALAAIPAFAAVSPAVRDWAVRRMVRERAPKGAVIVRQGAAGEKFYTIAQGRVEVEVAANGNRMTRELGPGDFFGEIALLHDVPRTATVVALQPLVLWTMSREDFEELQQRAAEFKESLWETATARLEESRRRTLLPAARG